MSTGVLSGRAVSGRMVLALIAAGDGTRLKAGGFDGPKGLVPVGGRPLVDWPLEAFRRRGVERVVAIVNEDSRALRDHLIEAAGDNRVSVVVKSTPSSMHSLFELAPLIGDTPFFLATVDSIFNDAELEAYVNHCHRASEADGVLAVTSHVDDERPLYVGVNDNSVVEAIGPRAEGSRWISGGLYFFRPTIFKEIPRARQLGLSRLRTFQEHLVDSGYDVRAHPFDTIVDVDHPEDIETAERFLKSWGRLNEEPDGANGS